MLRELHISNLAVIADARVELSRGLNCFTGVTGAGKSLVIGAIELLLGMRSGSELLRRGADEGRVSGVFQIESPSLLRQIGAVADVSIDSDGELLLTRRLHSSGRSSATVNGHPITLAMLKQIGELLVDVHGQHDHQFLLRPSNQLDVLDEYADTLALRTRYHDAWIELQQTRDRLNELQTGQTLRAQQLDLYRFQADEIDAAQLSAAEFDELNARSHVLGNLEKIKRDAGSAYAALYEADGAILERLKMMSAVLAELAMLDQNVSPIMQQVRDATLQLEDASFELGRYLDRLDLDPAELAEIDDRLNLLNRIIKKYGGDIGSTLQYREQIGKQIAELESADVDTSALAARIAPLEKQLAELAGKLSAERRKSADRLSRLIQAQLSDLGMDKAKLRIDLTTVAPTPTGTDAIEFIAQTNPGLPAHPLRKIASGGEMSRIMLALKSVLAAGGRVSVLVFDEIDSNVGGRLGAVIGGKLRALANHHQVLCITHLPQIAAYADRHLTVRKDQSGSETRTTVRTIDGEDRVEELAEMIGGHRITEVTRAQARELLTTAQSAGSPSRSTAARSTAPASKPTKDAPARPRKRRLA